MCLYSIIGLSVYECLQIKWMWKRKHSSSQDYLIIALQSSKRGYINTGIWQQRQKVSMLNQALCSSWVTWLIHRGRRWGNACRDKDERWRWKMCTYLGTTPWESVMILFIITPCIMPVTSLQPDLPEGLIIWGMHCFTEKYDVSFAESEIRPARLLTWCQKQTEGYRNVVITDLTTSWKSGIALCALIHRFKPQLMYVTHIR